MNARTPAASPGFSEAAQVARRPRSRLVAAGLVLAGLLAAALMLAAPAQAQDSGDGITPIPVSGDPSCAADLTELKVEPVAGGTFSNGTLTVTIDVRTTALGQVFDWSSNIGVDSIIVDGGDANLYVYDPPVEDTDDTSLHAPVNAAGQFSDLSRISFCYEPEDPVAIATGTPTTGTAPLTVEFRGSSSFDMEGPFGGPLTFAWDFGDGQTSTAADPTHTYTSPGTYTATLRVTDEEGGSDTDTVQVTVDPPTIDDLIDSVEALGLPSGLENSLLAKLTDAQTKLAAGDRNGACRALSSFTDEVRAQRGKKISRPDAAELISDARAVRASVPCGGG
jgi:PKD domain